MLAAAFLIASTMGISHVKRSMPHEHAALLFCSEERSSASTHTTTHAVP
jgi:hypothetical protein